MRLHLGSAGVSYSQMSILGGARYVEADWNPSKPARRDAYPVTDPLPITRWGAQAAWPTRPALAMPGGIWLLD